MNNDAASIISNSGQYEYGFRGNVKPEYLTGRGLTKETVRKIPTTKHEPKWMLDCRLKAYKIYKELPVPKFRPDLSKLGLRSMLCYQRMTDKKFHGWGDVPEDSERTFDRLEVPGVKREYLAGSSAQYRSEVVYHNMKDEFEKLGIVFTDADTILKEYPELLREWFGKLIQPTDNKFAALDAAVWSGGSFIYVPKGVKTKTPIQSCFRPNAENSG